MWLLSRRGFLGGVIGWLSTRGKVRGTPVQKQEGPVESVQDLIQQIRFLEQDMNDRAHIEAIQDEVRLRLLLVGMACVYVDEIGKPHVCALETKTGSLWSLPVRQSSLPWACTAWEMIGLDGLENRVRMLPRACDI